MGLIMIILWIIGVIIMLLVASGRDDSPVWFVIGILLLSGSSYSFGLAKVDNFRGKATIPNTDTIYFVLDDPLIIQNESFIIMNTNSQVNSTQLFALRKEQFDMRIKKGDFVIYEKQSLKIFNRKKVI